MTNLVIIGDAQDIREFLCGPLQHNEHVKGWRFAAYLADSRSRSNAMMQEANRIIAERRKYEQDMEAVHECMSEAAE